MKANEPALTFDAVEGRVPLHGLAHIRHRPADKRVEAASDRAFPARHSRDVGLHWSIAIGFCDLRISARKEHRLRGLRTTPTLIWLGCRSLADDPLRFACSAFSFGRQRSLS